jgi:hypothetical protein
MRSDASLADHGKHGEAAGVVATTKRRRRVISRDQIIARGYQIYFAANAIKTTTAITNAPNCTQRLLVKPL